MWLLEQLQPDHNTISNFRRDNPFLSIRGGSICRIDRNQLKINIFYSGLRGQYDPVYPKGIDKGCLILNTASSDGYKLLIIDNANKSLEAQYWKDDFLKVKQVSSEYNQTNSFLVIAKQVLTKQLTTDLDISKSEQIDLLNRSIDYFKTHESFKKEEFEKDVFSDVAIIDSFRSFDESYRRENEIELTDTFDISSKVVKKQARAFCLFQPKSIPVLQSKSIPI